MANASSDAVRSTMETSPDAEGGSARNHLFSEEHLEVLRDVKNWRLIASGLPEEVPPVRPAEHKLWVKRHTIAHSFREALIVLSGAGYQRLGARIYPVSAGTVMLFDSMEKHQRGYPPGGAPSDQLRLVFLADMVHAMLACVGIRQKRRKYRYVWERSYPLAALGLTCTRSLFPAAHAKAPPEAARWRCLTGLDMLVWSIVETGYSPQPDLSQEDFQGKVIAAAVKHIGETCGRNCSLENLSRLAGYSPCHFSRLFAKHACMSLPQCVNAARAVGFQKMLAEHMPLKAIAAELGFSHPSALSRWRRHQGL